MLCTRLQDSCRIGLNWNYKLKTESKNERLVWEETSKTSRSSELSRSFDTRLYEEALRRSLPMTLSLMWRYWQLWVAYRTGARKLSAYGLPNRRHQRGSLMTLVFVMASSYLAISSRGVSWLSSCKTIDSSHERLCIVDVCVSSMCPIAVCTSSVTD